MPRFAPHLHIVLYFFSFLALDFGLRWMCRFAQVVEDDALRSLLPFTFAWALLFVALAALLPWRLRQVYMTVLGALWCILAVVHGCYINMFRKFFSFFDMAFAGDGAAFVDSSYFAIHKLLFVGIVGCFVLMMLAVFLVPPRAKGMKMFGFAGIILAVAVIFCTRTFVLGTADAVIWNQNDDPAFLYEDFTDTRACLTMLGLYQYTFRDIQMLMPSSNTLTEEEVASIESYASAHGHEDNEMTGILEGKNLILIQLEAIDTWMLDYMPSLQAIKDESIVFANHYTPAYITAGTFNTEFMVNTSLLPAAAGTSMSVYTHNTFSNSIANLFANIGYDVNSFHGSEGDVYNREEIHENLGYTKYFAGSDMGMTDHTLDTQMMGGYEDMVAGDSFYSFIITYSGHGPYGDTNPIYLAHAEEAIEAATRTDGNYVYAVAHAMETDEFVADLVASLEEDGLLEDTVLVFYADHYNYYMLDDELNMEIKGVDSLNLLQHTDFFIYSSDLEAQTVEKYSSSLDVLPTLANLFNLDAQYEYFIGDDLFGEEGGYVFFNDNTWVGESTVELPWSYEEDIAQRRAVSTLILDGDYFGE